MNKHYSASELFETLKHVKLSGNTCLYTLEKCESMVDTINQINKLKEEKNAVILAHSYVNPDIIFAVADEVGDSYELSKKARQVKADTIIFVAVKFMAETAKLLNPDKEVLIPSKLNGCSLADSITGEQVRTLRTQYPDYSFVCYINTSAEVKAECDVCVTSSNVYKVIEALPNPNIYFLPDRLMGQNISNDFKSRGVHKNILYWSGSCYVHETYDPDMIRYIRSEFPAVSILSHPECSPEITALSDYVGSTTQMINHVKNTNAESYFMLTECGLTSRLQLDHPEKKFVGSCTMCRYMKSNQLDDILRVLKNPEPSDIIHINHHVSEKASNCLKRMFELS